MDYFYSPSTKGFYVEIVHGANMPSDVVKISEAEHTALIEGQSGEVEIVADAGRNGFPVLRPRVKPAPQE